MDVAHCGACEHIAQLHLGGRGRCRLNGCPCQRFEAPPTVAPRVPLQLVEVPTQPSALWIAGPAAIAFVAGLLIGINL